MNEGTRSLRICFAKSLIVSGSRPVRALGNAPSAVLRAALAKPPNGCTGCCWWSCCLRGSRGDCLGLQLEGGAAPGAGERGLLPLCCDCAERMLLRSCDESLSGDVVLLLVLLW